MNLPNRDDPIQSAPSPTLDSSFAARLAAYLRERFPFVANGLLILSFYSSNQFLAEVIRRPGEPMRYDAGSIAGAVTVFCFFLHMRIFDDHKDYEHDSRFFPDRVLQRGVVSLRDLKLIAFLAIAVELVLAFASGIPSLVAVCVALFFTFLMLKEFFVGAWLKRHFVIYALVHMLIMPLLAMTVWSFTTGVYFWNVSGWFALYSLVSYFLAFNWEISRKIRAPQDEIDGVDSYTRRFGLYGAANLVLVMRLIATVLVVVIGIHLNLSWWFYLLVVLLFFASGIGHAQYRLQTSTATAKRMEIYAGVYIVAFDLALAFELARKYGIEFGGGV